jgi:hypothetical protein
MVDKSDFGKDVANVHRGLKERVDSMPTASNDPNEPRPEGSIDRSVKEQVVSDLDHLIDTYDKR